METKTILIRYDEIGLKGKNRRHFENQLVKNIRYALRDIQNVKIDKIHGRILGRVNPVDADKCVTCLTFVAGIASLSIGNSIDPDFDKIAGLGIGLIKAKLEVRDQLKFCVRTRRSNKSFPYTSKEVDFEIGARIMEAISSKRLSVDINHADFIFEVEIGSQETIVFDNRIAGLSGLPVGSSGQVLSLLSGGIDSPVSTFKLMTRGCRVHSVFFDNRVFLGRGGYDKVVRLAHTLNRFQGGGKLFVIPFQNIQLAIRDHCHDSNRVVLYRRMMYRIAHAIAESKNCHALVTGESVGQVASQTLKNLEAVSCVVSTSVFRPLIGMNKQEIITEAKKIGTYEISIEAQPDCCSVFMPDHPTTRSKIKYLEADERLYPWEELMRQALESMETIHLDDLNGPS